jgi:hypothetical protein
VVEHSLIVSLIADGLGHPEGVKPLFKSFKGGPLEEMNESIPKIVSHYFRGASVMNRVRRVQCTVQKMYVQCTCSLPTGFGQWAVHWSRSVSGDRVGQPFSRLQALHHLSCGLDLIRIHSKKRNRLRTERANKLVFMYADAEAEQASVIDVMMGLAPRE